MKIEIDEDLRNFFIKEALKELLDEVEKQYVGSNRTKKLYKLWKTRSRDSIKY